MAHQIKFRRDTASNFTSSNPTLAAGEPGYETDTGKVKVGDGSTAWVSLAYLTGTGTVTSVDSGAGLTGGPVTGSGTIDVGAGTGITVNPNDIAVDMTAFDTDDLSEGTTNKYLTATNVLATDMTMKQFSETVNTVGNTSGSVTIDQNLGSIHTLTLTGAITQLAFSNLATGESGVLVLTQDGTGSHTFASTNMIFAGGAPTLTTAGGSIDVISYVSDGTNVLASFSGDYKA